MFEMTWVHVKQAFHPLNTYNSILLLSQIYYFMKLSCDLLTTIRIVTRWLLSDMLSLIEVVDFSLRYEIATLYLR